jgi:hypothetical protein
VHFKCGQRLKKCSYNMLRSFNFECRRLASYYSICETLQPPNRKMRSTCVIDLCPKVHRVLCHKKQQQDDELSDGLATVCNEQHACKQTPNRPTPDIFNWHCCANADVMMSCDGQRGHGLYGRFVGIVTGVYRLYIMAHTFLMHSPPSFTASPRVPGADLRRR